ncbi:MAG: c-type cytochrome [Chitinophagaceae bacterium]
MRSSIILICLLFGIITTAVIACTNATDNKETTAKKPLDSTALVARGKYLVSTIGCDDCHSPKRMGAHGPELIPELRFSGFQQNGQLPPVDTTQIAKGWILFAPDLTSAVGAWGASYSANITSDSTGIGNWTEENFFLSMREGKAKGLANNRPLLPPMPWQNFKNLEDEDLKAIFAYLKTTPPVKNVVPAPKPLAALK